MGCHRDLGTAGSDLSPVYVGTTSVPPAVRTLRVATVRASACPESRVQTARADATAGLCLHSSCVRLENMNMLQRSWLATFVGLHLNAMVK